MKPCSSNCESVNRRHKDAPSCVNGSLWNTPSHMLDDGKADAHAIAVCAKICSICAAALSFTIYTFWLVPSKKLLRFRGLRDFSTGSLDDLARGAFVLVPGLLVFAIVFLVGASRLFGQVAWHMHVWRELESHSPASR